MIITRTPLRISIGGGGTDLPSYYERSGGFVVAAAINKYIYVGINRTFTDDYVIKYSALERVKDVARIEHPIVRKALQLHPIGPALEIVSLAEVPAGAGLGSSGSFTVGLLRALHALKREHITPGSLAEEACRIEIELLQRAVGKQDQYVAAFGGMTCFEFCSTGEVRVSPLLISNETLHDLEENLLMFFTGYSRDASTVLEEQRTRSDGADDEMLDALEHTKTLGLSAKRTLEQGDVHGYAMLLNEHWQHKKRRSPKMSNGQIDRWYELGMSNGALGGKLVGAGAGGFLLFYAVDPPKLRAAMSREGLTELRFSFDYDGSTVVIRD